MPFDTLCKKLADESFDPEKYLNTEERKFFDFDESAYKKDQEEAQVMAARESPSPDDMVKKLAGRELKYGWMCGMDRDRRTQSSVPTYAEIVRNNGMMKKTAKQFIENAKDGLKEE